MFSTPVRMFLLVLALPFGAMASEIPVASVAAVDLSRYIGRWYEIASIPMFFQRNCRGDTTAEYRSRADGDIDVINRCRSEDGFIAAEGKASAVAGSGNSRLKVSFFWPFSSDYWIIGLDADYRWAVVGNPNRKTLWILSRTPQLAAADWQAARNAAQAQGYDLSQLRLTLQTETLGRKTDAP